jgi:hypothetical protein
VVSSFFRILYTVAICFQFLLSELFFLKEFCAERLILSHLYCNFCFSINLFNGSKKLKLEPRSEALSNPYAPWGATEEYIIINNNNNNDDDDDNNNNNNNNKCLQTWPSVVIVPYPHISPLNYVGIVHTSFYLTAFLLFSELLCWLFALFHFEKVS